LIRVHVHEGDATRRADTVDPAWLQPGSGVSVWVDLDQATPDEARILTEVFRFHELSVEDALSAIHHPKVESYGDYLYVILHGIDFQAPEHYFRTRDIDFFLGSQYLVTVHAGVSRSIGRIVELCGRNEWIFGEGPAALLHRIVDVMVDNYEPEIEALNERLDTLEKEVFEAPDVALGRRILDFKRDVASLRRVVLPQRDVVGRLARREFPMISEGLSYRFRDVHDHLVRLADESMFLQDRISSLLEANLATVSNQLNGIMKMLTLISTIFLPLTVLTGLYGMNVELPSLPGGTRLQFWWILVLMAGVSSVMMIVFRRRHWL